MASAPEISAAGAPRGDTLAVAHGAAGATGKEAIVLAWVHGLSHGAVAGQRLLIGRGD